MLYAKTGTPVVMRKTNACALCYERRYAQLLRPLAVIFRSAEEEQENVFRGREAQETRAAQQQQRLQAKWSRHRSAALPAAAKTMMT